MWYFSESCVEVKIHHEPSSFAKPKWVILQLPVLYPSMFNFLPDFVTSKLPFCIAKIRYAMYAYTVQDYSVLYINAVRPVIFEGLYFTHMWKTRAWLHHFTESGGLVPSN
jgi:hypothetical protein